MSDVESSVQSLNGRFDQLDLKTTNSFQEVRGCVEQVSSRAEQLDSKVELLDTSLGSRITAVESAQPAWGGSSAHAWPLPNPTGTGASESGNVKVPLVAPSLSDPSNPAYFDRLPDPPILRVSSFKKAKVSFKVVEECLQAYLLELGFDKSNFLFDCPSVGNNFTIEFTGLVPLASKMVIMAIRSLKLDDGEYRVSG